MTIRDKILVVEDDTSIATFMQAVLESNGYSSLLATSGAEAVSMIASHCPDLILLDLTLPDMDGMEILSRLRSWSRKPVIVVSARGRERDKVYALDQGADDYITKPFGSEELLARIRTALRHARQSGSDDTAGSGVFRLGRLEIDFNKHKVFVDGEGTYHNPSFASSP
jgi:two-component system KDP operon response regulator KdpE